VAFAQDEDELAGVIAHEMGHVVTRQTSADMTEVFKRVLKVTQVGGRDDIFYKFNQLIDAARLGSGILRREVAEQAEADRVSFWMAWRAGYDLQAFPRFFDRLTENKGAKGNVFSDLFGITRPESKRLRQMIKANEAIPAACRQQGSATNDAAFQAWRKMVTELSHEDLAARRSDLSPALTLSPRLRPELINLKFSPDGSLLIARKMANPAGTKPRFRSKMWLQEKRCGPVRWRAHRPSTWATRWSWSGGSMNGGRARSSRSRRSSRGEQSG